MRIPFKELIREFNVEHPGAKLNKLKLAKEMVEANVFKSLASAKAMMWYNESGRAKSIDLELYHFTLKYFGKKGSEIIVE